MQKFSHPVLKMQKMLYIFGGPKHLNTIFFISQSRCLKLEQCVGLIGYKIGCTVAVSIIVPVTVLVYVLVCM